MNLPSRGVLRALALLSVLELLSVTALLINLATLHLRPVTALLGPTHGALFLAVAVTALLARGLLPRTRWMALIPVAGGVLTLVNVRIERARAGSAGSVHKETLL
ncbi:MAG: hypothetical protein AVDCRST_MAG83-3230 [uncultured Arthrobacter sp.]|uniref:DUF3817 domain-containing protein n=1 Tax=uncultured Arthrobacter sp. TaxID=114050 RepID=A0A6J4J4B3_9MICC|nr:hypothetical protein [uncultured Arthrobacter sp.]CAA9270293.1 MAG: hypothetical protein AVDCRST_MAG83-3230 [uncultured Arthrobacter sp.]